MPGSSLIHTASLTVQGSFSFLQSTPRLAPLLVPASPETSGTISKRQTLIKCQREHYRERTERNTGWLWWHPLVSTTLNDTRSLEKIFLKHCWVILVSYAYPLRLLKCCASCELGFFFWLLFECLDQPTLFSIYLVFRAPVYQFPDNGSWTACFDTLPS